MRSKILRMRRPSKYHNKKVEVDGMLFDSQREASVYKGLKIRQDLGEIFEIRRQVVFVLLPPQLEVQEYHDKKGRPRQRTRVAEKAVKYIADFVVIYANGDQEVIDAKGMRTAVYKIKKKLMRYVHGIKITEI